MSDTKRIAIYVALIVVGMIIFTAGVYCGRDSLQRDVILQTSDFPILGPAHGPYTTKQMSLSIDDKLNNYNVEYSIDVHTTGTPDSLEVLSVNGHTVFRQDKSTRRCTFEKGWDMDRVNRCATWIFSVTMLGTQLNPKEIKERCQN